MANKGNVGTLSFGVKIDLKKFQKNIKKMKKSLAKFGESVAKVGKAVGAMGAGVAAGLLASAKAFADYGDEVAKTSRRTGVAVEDLTKLQFAAERSGGSMEKLTDGLKDMNKNIADAKGGAGISKTLAEIGLNAEDLLKLNASDRFDAIAKGLSEMKSPAEQSAAAMKIFGEAGHALLPLFQEGEGGLAALKKEAERLGITMSALDATNAEKLTDAFGDLGAQVKNVFIKIGAQMAKSGLIDVIQSLVDKMPVVYQWITDVGERFRIWAQAALPDLLASFGALWDGVSIVFENILAALSSMGLGFANTAEDTTENFSGMFLSIGKFFSSFSEHMAKGIIKLGDFIGNALLLPIKLIGEGLFHLFNQLSKLPKVGKQFAAAANDINDLLNKTAKPVSAIFAEELKGLNAIIAENDKKAEDKFKARSRRIEGFVSKSLEAAKKVSEPLKGFVSKTVDAVVKTVDAIEETVKDDIKITPELKLAEAATSGSLDAFRIQNQGRDNKVQNDQLKVQKQMLNVLKKQPAMRGI